MKHGAQGSMPCSPVIHRSLKRATRKSRGWSRAGYKEANDILIAGRNELELLAQASWRLSLPIACGLTDSPRRSVSAVDLAPPQRRRCLTQEASGVPCTPGPTLAPGRC